MIKKANALGQNGSNDSGETSYGDSIVVDGTEGKQLLFIANVALKPGATFSPKVLGNSYDILEFMTGSGRVSTDADVENVQEGDRVTLSIGEKYVVDNNGNIPLRFLRVALQA